MLYWSEFCQLSITVLKHTENLKHCYKEHHVHFDGFLQFPCTIPALLPVQPFIPSFPCQSVFSLMYCSIIFRHSYTPMLEHLYHLLELRICSSFSQTVRSPTMKYMYLKCNTAIFFSLNTHNCALQIPLQMQNIAFPRKLLSDSWHFLTLPKIITVLKFSSVDQH